MIGLIYKLTKLKLDRLEKECHLCHYLEQNYQNNMHDIKNSGVRKEEDAISVADVATIKNMKLDKNVSKMYQTLKRRDMIRQEEFKSQASKSMAYGADMSEVSMHFEDQSENANYFVLPGTYDQTNILHKQLLKQRKDKKDNDKLVKSSTVLHPQSYPMKSIMNP